MSSPIAISLETDPPGMTIVKSTVDLDLKITIGILGSSCKQMRLFYTPISDSLFYLHKPALTGRRGIVKAVGPTVATDFPCEFTAKIKAANLYPSYHYLVIAYSKEDGYIPAILDFRVDGERTAEPGNSTDTAASVGPSMLAFDPIPNSTTVPNNADLNLTIHSVPGQATMVVNIDRYILTNNVPGNKKTYTATINGADPTLYTATVPNADIDPDTYYMLFAYGDKPHVPCTISFHSKP